MFTKYYKWILFSLGVFLTTSLYAVDYFEEDEVKHNTEEKPKQKELLSYYNYTLEYSKGEIDNIVNPAALENEQEDFKDNNSITRRLKNKQGAIFFTVITSNKQTKALNKFFFINSAPHTEKEAIGRAEKSYGCHVISHIKPEKSPHIIFQLLGWLAQEEKKYRPIFIHSNAAICCTCALIVSSLLKINMPSNAQGCNGDNSIDLAHTCPLAQQYIKSELTLPLAKKLFLPTVGLGNKLKKLESTEKKRKQMISAILREKNNLAAQCDRLNTQKKSLQKSYNDLKNKKQLLKNSYDNLEAQKDALEEKNRSLKKEKKSCTLFTCLLSIVLTISSGVQYLSYNPLQKSYKTIEQDYSSLNGSDNDIGNNDNSLNDSYNSLKDSANSLNNSYNSLNDSANSLSNSCNATEKHYKSILKERIALRYSPLNGHSASVMSVAITSNNKYIVSGSQDTTIRIWDLKTGEELSYSPLEDHASAILSVVISAGNKYILTGSEDHTIRIWDLKTGKELSLLKGQRQWGSSVAISSHNRYIVSGSWGDTVRIWDSNTGQEVAYSPLKGHKNRVRSVAVTGNNKYIVSGSEDHTIRIWSLKTGREVAYSPLKGHKNGVNSVAISSNNRYIVSGSDDKTIRIWNLKTGKQLPYSPLTCHNHTVNSVAVTHDNRYIVSGSEDRTIRIWDIKTGKQLSYSPLKGHTGGVESVAISSHNKYIVSGSGDKTIRIWDLQRLLYLSNITHETK